MEAAVVDLEKQMRRTDAKLDDLAARVGGIATDLLAETAEPPSAPGAPRDAAEVQRLLTSVGEVRTSYQSLRRELREVQGLQRDLSARLGAQLRAMQRKCERLRERVTARAAAEAAEAAGEPHATGAQWLSDSRSGD